MGFYLSTWMHEVTARLRTIDRDANPANGIAYVVHVSDTGVTVTNDKGKSCFISWSKLQTVEIETRANARDGGSSSPDPELWWVLTDGKRMCRVPQGGIGEASLIAYLQDLPGFDNGALKAAIRCTTDYRFLCWTVNVPQRRAARWHTHGRNCV